MLGFAIMPLMNRPVRPVSPFTVRHGAFLTLLVSCAAIGAPKAANKLAGGLPRYGMAVYSDLCVNRATGEFGGQRVTVQRFAEVDTVIYEYTAGGLSWPLVAADVQIGPHGEKLVFTVQMEEEERTLSGTVADQGNTFVLDGGHCGQADAPSRLAKVKDFGLVPPPCKPCPAKTTPATPAASPASMPQSAQGGTA